MVVEWWFVIGWRFDVATLEPLGDLAPLPSFF